MRIALRLPPGGERVDVFRIRLQRMYGGIKARVGPRAIERPKAAHVALGMGGHRLGEIASRRTHGADDRDRALVSRKRSHARGALVELGQAAAQVSRITGLGGQLAEAARDLAQGLRPPAGGIGHESDV